MALSDLGWNLFFEAAFASLKTEGLHPGRVAMQHRGGYLLYELEGELKAEVSGRFRHAAHEPSEFPTVGDWVAFERVPGEERAIIHQVLPRQSRFSRTAAGDVSEEQVLASNIDHALVVESLGSELNLRRLERFLTVVRESGAVPSIILTKRDLCRHLKEILTSVNSIACDATVHSVSSLTGQGLQAIRKLIKPGETAALLGPSGVGKSTLINTLWGDEILPVLPVRESDQKGRHTTSCRELVFLPGGGLMIDTPGLRELQLWEGEVGLRQGFADVEEMALACRFTNCGHDAEPGCALRVALQEGRITAGRLASFRKLRQELEAAAKRQQDHARIEESRRSKGVTRSLRGKKFRQGQQS